MTSDDMLHLATFCGIWRLQHTHRVSNSSNDAISSALRASQAYISGVGCSWVGGGFLFEVLGLVSKNNLSAPPCLQPGFGGGPEALLLLLLQPEYFEVGD
jgi:hypothetical protein